jgi:cell division protein FtsI (penicillin-binding protein 3)
MPEVTGLSLRKALQHLTPFHLNVQIKGSGKIVGQNPAAGESLAGVDLCRLILKSRM